MFTTCHHQRSLPSWERGLKSFFHPCNMYMGQSLPSWERGLKLSSASSLTVTNQSLPSWERGLKCLYPPSLVHPQKSLPSWERGLKFCDKRVLRICITVAPFVGAWIEMKRLPVQGTVLNVAPFVGAWIEIHISPTACRNPSSLPSWERGLKSARKRCRRYPSMSLPSWERGLKYSFLLSPPMLVVVAPFVGAWIEISPRNPYKLP